MRVIGSSGARIVVVNVAEDASENQGQMARTRSGAASTPQAIGV